MFPQVTPILAVLLTVGAALLLVFVVISAYFCLTRRAAPSPRNRKANGSPGSGNNGFQVRANGKKDNLIIHDHPTSQEPEGNFSSKIHVSTFLFSLQHHRNNGHSPDKQQHHLGTLVRGQSTCAQV